MGFKESSTVELKSCMTRTFLKTVSAFANFGTGQILFGVEDNGEIIGLDDVRQVMHDIENSINDAIKPTPRYTLNRSLREGSEVVVLEVFEGLDKPYFYKNKAYKRNNTSTVEVDKAELGRLVLEGQNLSFEEVVSKNQDLRFERLSRELKKKTGISEVNEDILKTMQLYSDGIGFNNAAAVVADKNSFAGIDIIRFGSSEDEIFERKELSGVSALVQLDSAMEMFSKHYQPERIEDMRRRTVDLVPEDAFREAIANALVHRLWDSPASIRVAMFPDRIQVHSPGGLPSGITEQEYKEGRVSLLRNPIVCDVFFRLGHIERFGTGVRRIKRLYEGTTSTPRFDVSQNVISVTLPVIEKHSAITVDEETVLDALSMSRLKSRAEIQNEAGFAKDKTARIIRALVSKGIVEAEGRGRATSYRRRV